MNASLISFNSDKTKMSYVAKYVFSICQLPMQEQHQKLKETFANWKREVEKVDDVSVIGFRI